MENAGINPEDMTLQKIEMQYQNLCSDRRASSAAYKAVEKENKAVPNACQ